jgi:hypothetical protein
MIAYARIYFTQRTAANLLLFVVPNKNEFFFENERIRFETLDILYILVLVQSNECTNQFYAKSHLLIMVFSLIILQSEENTILSKQFKW